MTSRALGPLAVPGVATIRTTLPPGRGRSLPGASAHRCRLLWLVFPAGARIAGRASTSPRRVSKVCRRVRSGSVPGG
jgi:hypothetical protein